MSVTTTIARSDEAVLKVLSVASEMYPLIKTGGLADVVGALPGALTSSRVAMRTLLPGYPAVIDALQFVREVLRWPNWFGGPARLLSARHGATELLVLDAPHLYARPGNPYLDAEGRDWPDNAERFAALSFAAARIGWGELGGFVPDVIHVHDWQAALVPVYLQFMSEGKRRPATILTLHNLAFQGQFSSEVFARLGMPDAANATHGLEYFGDINYLKAAILFADAITTVSPTYAREILTPAGGMGMDAMLRWRGAAVSGIVNGIDIDVWNPAIDALLARTYDVDTLSTRVDNKRAVEERFGLPVSDAPLICMITRLTEQKGIDLVVEALDAIAASGARMVVLGSGDARLEAALAEGASRWPDRIAVEIGYDEGLSHLMQGGCDAILIPSRFEPCGLTQLYGLRYGCVPVVSRVGGLADTVVDASDAALQTGVATGIQFTDISVDGVTDAVRRAVDLHRHADVWKRVQIAGMRSDVSWDRSAAAFAALYRTLLDQS
jgi:starch synthase